MTRRPPDPLPGAAAVQPPDQPGLEAWQQAYLEHQKRVRAETRRWAAESLRLRGRYGLPPGSAPLGLRQSVAWHQAALDELDPPDDIVSPPGGPEAYWPPCERDA